MAKVFISYSRRDEIEISKMIRLFTNKGYEVLIDLSCVCAGDFWVKKIAEAIRNCDVFVLVLSQNSVRSKIIHKEVSLAFEERKHIVPISIEDVVIPDEIRLFLTGLHTISIHGNPDGMDVVVKALDQIINQVIQTFSEKISIERLTCTPTIINQSESITVYYHLSNCHSDVFTLWLGASLIDRDGMEIWNPYEDRVVSVPPGNHIYSRVLSLKRHILSGKASVIGAIWIGPAGDADKSIRAGAAYAERDVVIQEF